VDQARSPSENVPHNQLGGLGGVELGVRRLFMALKALAFHNPVALFFLFARFPLEGCPGLQQGTCSGVRKSQLSESSKTTRDVRGDAVVEPTSQWGLQAGPWPWTRGSGITTQGCTLSLLRNLAAGKVGGGSLPFLRCYESGYVIAGAHSM
jgi:hypothetical protein